MNNDAPLRLYVNPAWRRGGIFSVFMIPWWGNPYEEASALAKQTFDAYSFDTTLYTVTDDVKTADMVLAPYRHEWFLRHDKALFEECVRTAEGAHLPLLVDGIGDVEHHVEAKNAYILRYGGYRFMHERGRIQIPPIADDLLERYETGRLTVRKKTRDIPSVGFSGWAALTPVQYMRTLVKEFPLYIRGVFDSRYRACVKGVLWRKKAIRILQSSPLVKFQSNVRRSFSGNPKTAIGDVRTLQKEMVTTILESDYCLDVRGDANDSTRLFEILSLGRIPVIVDTERNFPFSDKIDYSSFALIIDFRDIKKLPDRIAEFHRTVSPERFEQMQKNARETYLRFFRIDAVARPIIGQLQDMMTAKMEE